MAMIRRGTSLLLLIVLFSFLSVGSTLAQDREILYSKSLSSNLNKIAAIIQNPHSERIPYADLTRRTDYFVRIAPRRAILAESNEVKEGARLGTKPFIFLTTPECIYGKALLDIYLDIGYGAKDIIRWQRGEDMVVIVFRYPEAIQLADIRDGRLPCNWDGRMYVPTWENLFSLFHKLASNATIEPNKKGEFAPEKIFFRSEEEKDFVLGFPEEGKQRIQETSYACLQSIGGADWVYRQLLEKKLSILEHFRGNGRTRNEVIGCDGGKSETGILEFVGPNREVSSLPEFVIIHLGKLTMSDTYSRNQ